MERRTDYVCQKKKKGENSIWFFLGTCLIVIIYSISSLPNAEGQQTTVMGQSNPATDIQAVQAAVDQGGTVLLKGTFDFGDKGRVDIEATIF